MKRFLFIIIITLVTTYSFSQLKIGGGATFGTDMSIDQDLGVGLNIRGDYTFNDKWSISSGFTYTIPSTFATSKYKSWQINTDIHYKYYTTDKLNLYGLGGINYTNEKYIFQTISQSNNKFSTTEESRGTGTTGFNIGTGINYKRYFGEIKFDSSYKQLGVTFGVYF